MTATLTAVETIANGEIGQHESPPNSNKQKYGVWYGFNGVAWCAIFVSWVLWHAGDRWYRFASVASAVAKAKKDGRLVSRPQPGFVACKLYTATKGHTGVVAIVHSDGTLTTWEGNTSGADDRDGGTVMLRRRSASWWNQGFIKIEYSNSTPSVPTPPQEQAMLKIANACDRFCILANDDLVITNRDGAIFHYDADGNPDTIEYVSAYNVHPELDDQPGPEGRQCLGVYAIGIDGKARPDGHPEAVGYCQVFNDSARYRWVRKQ